MILFSTHLMCHMFTSFSPKPGVSNKFLLGSERGKLLHTGYYKAEVMWRLLLVNAHVGIVTSLIKILILRLTTCLSLIVKWLRINWNSDFGNCSCFCFAFETLLFIVVEKKLRQVAVFLHFG